MQEIKYFPVGRVKLTPMQKKNAVIRRLRYWVAVLAIADVMYTALMVAMLYGMVTR